MATGKSRFLTAAARRFGMTGVFLCVLSAGLAQATTYYVSSSLGNDANAGTSAAAPWQTLAQVNAQTLNPGDTVLFNRGDVWNESLVPASSGTAGSPITFDAYGVGPAPNFTGYYAVPSTAWTNVTGNAWKAKLPANYTTVNFCLFGSIWGQKVPAATSNLTAQWDFYFVNVSGVNYLYVYSAGNPGTNANLLPIVPMALSNVPVINVNSQSWLVFQHILVNWFDEYGVYVQGTSDHLVFANMEVDSLIPQGTQPLGFYVNESAPGPGDIKIYNAEAHMNYDGFRFDGAATAVSMVNDKAYANRDGALVDNTGAVTYSYCHFYASSLAVAGSTDVEWTTGTGPIAGGGNVAADTAPAVQMWQRYPARVTLTVDDAGMTVGADTYYAGTVLPIAAAAGVPVGAAITVGYPLAQTLIGEFQSWINQGLDVTAHSWSHTYYTNTNALTVQYTGTGSAATLSISGNVMTVTATGDAASPWTFNLGQGQAQGTVLALENALNATGKFTATLPAPPCQGPYGTGCSFYTASALLAQDLATVTGQDVKTNPYTLQLNVSQLQTDEITQARQWMTTNLTGLSATPVYVYPGGYEDPAMEAITAGIPFAGARGALHEGGTANNGQPITGAKDTYASGYNVQNITSFGVNPTWMGLTPASLNQKVQALVWKEMVWGVPWGIFWHYNSTTQAGELSATEVTNLIADLQAGGATFETNTSLVNWLVTGTLESGNDGNFYYKSAANGSWGANGAVDFRPTAESPVVDAGENLGAAYAIDINGVNQNANGSGWEIGAHAYIPYATYGEAGAPTNEHFVIGGGAASLMQAAWPQLPQTWVDNNEATDGLAYTAPQYELNLGTEAWVSGPPAGCTFHLPYWTVGSPTFAGLQSAVNDAETCRTATGAGMFVDIPPALYTTTNTNGLVLPQTNTAQAASFIVLRSTGDSYLPAGQTACAHGIQDNLSTSTDIGLVNPDCTGQNMYYQLGPQNSSNVATVTGTITGVTTLSTNTTTLAAITSSGTAQCVALANGYVAPGVAEVVDTGTNQETVTTTSAANQTGMCGVFTKNHASGVPVQFCANGCTYTLANGNVINTANYNDLQYMWQVQSSGSNPSAVTFCNPSATAIAPTCTANMRPDHWLIEDMAASMAPGNNGNNYIVNLNHDSTTTAQLAQHIHFRKNWIHGDWTSLITGANFVSAALELGDCEYCSVVDNQISQILRPAAECHGISANGTTYKIVHNWVEGCSIGMLSGGYSTSGPSIPGWLPFQDVEVRRNRFTYPYAWLGQSPIANGVNTACCNSAWSTDRKNSFEIKEGARVLEVGNIGEDVDNSGVQNGIGSDWNTWNASGGGSGSNYQAEETDLVFTNNILRNTCTGFEMQGAGRNQGGVTLPFERGLWSQNLLYSVTGNNPGCSNADDYAFNFESALNQWQGTVTENSNGTATFTANCSVYEGTCIGQVATGSVATAGTGCVAGSLTIGAPNLAWGIQATGTYKCTSGALSSVTITNNGTGYTSVPTATIATGTGTVTLTINTSSSAPPTGFTQLDFIAGQHLWVTQCPTTAFNPASVTKDGNIFPTTIGPAAVAGTNPASLVVTYPWTGATSGTSDTSGYCMISNFPGMPYNVQFTHNTAITDAGHSISSTNAASQNAGPNYEQNARFQDDIILGGGFYNNALGAGCNTINWNFDPGTFTVDHMVLPGVTTSYSGCLYGNNPYFPVSTPVLYEPTTSYCTGSTPSSSCVGFAGAMSTSSMPLTLSDYHGYELMSSSVFAAGGSEQASDSTAAGANILAIDGAETATQFVCPSWATCGTVGPYADNLPATGTPVAAYAMGIDYNNVFPTQPHQIGRFWDLSKTHWSYINTCTNGTNACAATATSFNWSGLDSMLSQMAAGGVSYMQMPLARTPNFASGNPVDTNCNYWNAVDSGTVNTAGTTVTLVSGTAFTTGSSWNGNAIVIGSALYTIASVTSGSQLVLTASAGTQSAVTFSVGPGSAPDQLPGQCEAPSDLNTNGTGANLYWRNWVAALASHVNQPGYVAGTGAWAAGGANCPGTTACPHARLLIYEDWNEPDDTAFFNGSYAQLQRMEQDMYCIVKGGTFTIAATGETCTQVRATVTSVALTGPVDTTAWVVMPSYHGGTTAKAQAFLYCTGSGVGSQACTSGGGAAQTDAINFHLKCGASTSGLTGEAQCSQWLGYIDAILQPAELAKPLFNTEGGFNGSGWLAPYTDADMQAAFIARDYIYELSLGISNHVWYDWDSSHSGLGSTTADTAYGAVESWLAGASFQGCTTSAPGTAMSGAYTYTCQITLANGQPAVAMWDNSQTCSNGTCTTTTQWCQGTWKHYWTVAGTSVAMTGQTVPVGIKPVLLVNE